MEEADNANEQMKQLERLTETNFRLQVKGKEQLRTCTIVRSLRRMQCGLKLAPPTLQTRWVDFALHGQQAIEELSQQAQSGPVEVKEMNR